MVKKVDLMIILNKDRVYYLILVLVVVVFFIHSLPLLANATLNKGVVMLFSSDEWNAVKIVDNGLNDIFTLDWFHNYGSIYYYTTITLLFPFKFLGLVTDQIIIITLRSVSLIAGCLTILIVFYTGKRFFNTLSGLVAAFMLATTNNFIYWSGVSHPDIHQLLFVTVSIYYILEFIERKDKKHLIFSSAFAGFAFGTKYVGVFLLPAILFSIFLVNGFNKNKIKSMFCDIAVIFLVFVIAYVVTNPVYIIKIKMLIGTFNAATSYTTSGGEYSIKTSGLLWFDFLRSNEILGDVLFVLAVLSVSHVIIHLTRSLPKKDLSNNDEKLIVLLVWILTLLTYLILQVYSRRPRYLLPVIPTIYLIIGYSVTALSNWIGKQSKPMSKVFLTTSIILIVAGSVYNLDIALSGKHNILSREEKIGSHLQMGRWIEENYGFRTKILYFPYIYIPPKFKDTINRWEITDEYAERIDPDVVLISSLAIRRYCNVSKTDQLQKGQDRYRGICSFFQRIKTDTHEIYRTKKHFKIDNETEVWIAEKEMS